MPDTLTDPKTGDPMPKLFEDSEEDKEPETKSDDTEKMEDGEGDSGPDVGAVCKAIEKGTISIADFAEIQAAMAAVEGAVQDDEVAETPPEPSDSPAEPDPAVMNDQRATAKFEARIAATEGKLRTLEQEKANADARTTALAELDGYAYFATTPEAKVDEVLEKHGVEGLRLFVKFTKDTASRRPVGGHSRDPGVATGDDMPDEVRKFCATPEEGEAAQKAWAAFQTSKNSGMLRGVSFDDYFNSNREHFGS